MIQRLKPQCSQDKMMRVKYVKSIRRVVSDVQVSGFITIKWIIHFSNRFCFGSVTDTIELKSKKKRVKAQITIFTL